MNSDWQPIETAPKDGTRILVWDGDLLAVADWDQPHVCARTNAWCVGECDGEYNDRTTMWKPTHWMPLPEPPSK